jgi:hypothetical protein
MANIPISQLPQAFSAYPDSLLVIVNYDLVPTGQTNYIYYSALTAQFSSGTSGTSGSSGKSFTWKGNWSPSVNYV